MRTMIHRLSTILMVLFITLPASAEPVRELDWDELMPADWAPVNPFAELSDEELAGLSDASPEAQEMMRALQEAFDTAPVVEALDGQQVRLPGFVVPLEFTDTEVREFLLVPYYGACIHVPPPPANQMVFVLSEWGAKINGLFDIVSVTGILRARASDSPYGAAGYTLEAEKVEPYVYEEG